MEEITLKCRTITPMFCYGADDSEPEIRPPSIKGGLRFWWRAMNPDSAVTKMKENEAELFGGTGEKEGRSKVIIQVNGNNIEQDITKKLINKHNYPGLGYLFYSRLMAGNQDKNCIKPGQGFEIKIKSNDNKYIEKVKKVFLVFSLFGGIGSRSRRGGGNFLIEEGLENNFFDPLINSKEGLKRFIKDNVRPLIEKSSKSFSTLKGAKVYVFNPEKDWKRALETIGEPFSTFRGDHKGRVDETPNFGFPISHKNGMTMVAGKKKENNKDGFDLLERRSSPLIFKVIKTAEEKYFPLIIWLAGDLLPDKYKFMDKNKKNNQAYPDEKIINEFFDYLKGKNIEFLEIKI
ncbi:MAG: type III-B CRISPR module RAMP protein Cmr1 [Desulfobacteraceae bacterium]